MFHLTHICSPLIEGLPAAIYVTAVLLAAINILILLYKLIVDLNQF